MEQRSVLDQRIARLEAAQAAVGAAQAELLAALAECDDEAVWESDGAYGYAHWVALNLGITSFVARRRIRAAHALPSLPRLRAALESGSLSLDVTVELVRFATPDTERKLIAWAKRVSLSGVKARADAECARPLEEVVQADRGRYLRHWWLDGGNILGIEGYLPAAQGVVVAKALDRLAGRAPDIIEDEDDDDHDRQEFSLEARRADALYYLCSRAVADDGDPDRATVVVHAPLEALLGDDKSCVIEGGPAIHPETARRLCCDARLQVALHDRAGRVVGLGRTARLPTSALQRLLRERDRGCRFPGCEWTRFLHAHHVEWWGRGGATDLDNLVLVCGFHHKLVHEYGWSLEFDGIDEATWFRPDGTRYESVFGAPAERAPPERARLVA